MFLVDCHLLQFVHRKETLESDERVAHPGSRIQVDPCLYIDLLRRTVKACSSVLNVIG
jgi:hypothetical protein